MTTLIAQQTGAASSADFTLGDGQIGTIGVSGNIRSGEGIVCELNAGATHGYIRTGGDVFVHQFDRVRTLQGPGTFRIRKPASANAVGVFGVGVALSRIDQYLSTNGDGTGEMEATGDYSSTQEIFYIQPASTDIYYIRRMLVFYEDNLSFDSGAYGNSISITGSDGIQVRVQNDSGTISDLTAGQLIQINPHWKRQCYDTDVSSYGSGDESLGARWTFEKAGSDIRLDGSDNQRLEVVLDGNFSGLEDQAFLVQGRQETI